MYIEEPSARQFKDITHLIGRFELDDREMRSAQFLSAVSEDLLIGFGRIREYPTCSELCSLGVVEPQRYKGIGTRLVRALIEKAPKPLYLVCIIPEFFERLGFRVTTSYPSEIRKKLEYCRQALAVPEEYIVMTYEKGEAK